MLTPSSRKEPDRYSAIHSDVVSRFGLLPNFFRTADDAPGLISGLWVFAKSAYLDNPLPSLFKERLFVHLSRFCDVRYCIVRHVGFLIGEGNPAGDPSAVPETVEQVAELLRRPGLPDVASLSDSLSRLAAYSEPAEIPAPGSPAEWDIFVAASVMFLQPAQSGSARIALRTAIGAPLQEVLTAYLAFIRTAHYWTQTHPDLSFEDDMELVMRQHEQLAQLMLDPSDVERSQIGTHLFSELEMLREERDDRIALREALARNEKSQRRQQLLINELNHRVKNTLSIIQSIAMQTLRGNLTFPEVRDAFMGRLLALANAHDILTAESWESAELGQVLSQATGMHQEAGLRPRIILAGPEIHLAPSSAVALAMAAHELATNAVKYGALSNDTGHVDISWGLAASGDAPKLWLQWAEHGGPAVRLPTRKGFGSRLIERGLAGELNGCARINFDPAGLICFIEAPIAGNVAG